MIQEIRTAIFDLHGGQSGITRLRQRLDEAIAQFATPRIRTTVQYSGPCRSSTPHSPTTRRPWSGRL